MTEIDRLTALLELQQGCIREVLKTLLKGAGGCKAKAIADLSRHLPEEEVEEMRKRWASKPCP